MDINERTWGLVGHVKTRRFINVACTKGLAMKRILFLAGLTVILVSCGPDECLTKLEPWSVEGQSHINLVQCWNQKDQIRFYTTSQGSQLAPYELIVPLELVDAPDKTKPDKLVFTGERFFTKSHIEDRWRFLALEESERDDQSGVDKDDVKDGWPIGFVIDKRSSGKEEWRGEWLGLTCAACHTTQFEYKDKNGKEWKVRIDGGPALSDEIKFLQDLKHSLEATYDDGPDGTRFKAYEERYIKKFGQWDEEKQVRLGQSLHSALGKVVAVRTEWHGRNDPPSPPGYGRLDAFGVIYNQVVAVMVEATQGKPERYEQAGSTGYDSPPNAPVSYPFLWDTSFHDWTQWNGMSSEVPVTRNVGQVVGVFGKVDTGHGLAWFFGPLDTTVQLGNLMDLQERIDRLRSPKWPEKILGGFDDSRVARGRQLFKDKCVRCHEIQERAQPLRHVNVNLSPLEEIKTDPRMAENAFCQTIQKREITSFVDTAATWAQGEMITKNVLCPMVQDKEGTTERPVRLALGDIILPAINTSVSGFITLFGESIGIVGNCLLHKVSDKFPCKVAQTLVVYKGRPMDGIWATAPYLHNGSVPNLYELLLPEAKRSTQFCVGSRQFDPQHVGFVMLTEADCRAKNFYWFDTSQDGDRNTGHDGPSYGVYDEQDIWALVEYMKTL